MRISFSTGTFYHRGLGYSLDLAREAGFDGVELVLGPEYLLRGEDASRRIAAGHDVPVLSVHPPFYPLPGWPRGASRAVPRLASVSRSVGAELCVVHTPFLRSPTSPRARSYSESLRRGSAATGGEVRVTLESSQYNKRRERYLLDDLKALVDFAQERGCGVTFDTCHAGANREDILACYETVRPALRNVHLSDVQWKGKQARTHILPGEGELPLADFLARLARDGYEGLVTMEIHPRQVEFLSRQRSLRRLKQALDFVRTSAGQAKGVKSGADL